MRLKLNNYCYCYYYYLATCISLILLLSHQLVFMLAAKVGTCPKYSKEHDGVKLIHNQNKKNPSGLYPVGDILIYECLTTQERTSLKCLPNGQWEEPPQCSKPKPCLVADTFKNGTFNSTHPVPAGTKVLFLCDDEYNALVRQSQGITETLSNNRTIVLPQTRFEKSNATVNISQSDIFSILNTYKEYGSQSKRQFANDKATPLMNIYAPSITYYHIISQYPQRFDLVGPRLLKCSKFGHWSGQIPTCILKTEHENSDNLGSDHNITLVLLFVTLMLTLALIIAFIIYRWRKRQQNRARWKKYFTDYKYRHSRTNFSVACCALNSEMTQFGVGKTTDVPVTDL